MEPNELATKQDLNGLEDRLINKLDEIVKQPDFKKKQWLRSADVCEVLSISSSCLQNYRINGTISYTKVGGILYYEHSDVVQMMEENKVNSHS